MTVRLKAAAADTPAALLPAVMNLPHCGLSPPTLCLLLCTQYCNGAGTVTCPHCGGFKLKQARTAAGQLQLKGAQQAADRLCFSQLAPRAPWAAVGFWQGPKQCSGHISFTRLLVLSLPLKELIHTLHPPMPVCQSLPAQMAQQLPPTVSHCRRCLCVLCCLSFGSCRRPSSSEQQQQQSATAPAQQQQQQSRLAAAHRVPALWDVLRVGR